MDPADTHVIRFAEDADEAELERLAQLDSARPVRRPTLVAELDGRVAAALDLGAQRTIANPFLPTATLRAQLHARAGTLEAARHEPGVADRIRAALRRERIVLA